MGEAFALITAVTWAFSVILFKKSGEQVHPLGLNLFKNVLAMVLLIPTAIFFGEDLLRPSPIGDYLLLLFSGAIGIALADTLFFKSLNILGASRSAIIDCLYSPFIIGMSVVFIGETMSVMQFVGVALIVSAVLSVSRENNNQGEDRKQVLLGFLYGALAMATMGAGIVMVKPLLDRSPLLWVTEVRIIGGVIAMLMILPFMPNRRAITASIRSTRRWAYTLFGSLTGGYIAMVIWVAGMKYTQASTAAALNQTSNVFIFIFAAIFLREKITLLRLIGIILAVSGVMLVTFG